jgi:hypothetical protein
MVKLLHPKKPYIYYEKKSPSAFPIADAWYGLRIHLILAFSLIALLFSLHAIQAQTSEAYLKLEYHLDVTDVKDYHLNKLFLPFLDEQGGFKDVDFDESRNYFSVVVYGNAGKELCEQQFKQYNAVYNLISNTAISKTEIKNSRNLIFKSQQNKGERREERFATITKEDGKTYYVFERAWFDDLPEVKKERIKESGVLFILKD